MRHTIIFLVTLTLTTTWATPLLKPEAYQYGKVTLIDPKELNKAANITDNRIINGQQANQGQFPYQAAVTFKTSSGTYFCGGALISNQWILTAAHCASGATSFTIQLGGTTVNGNQDGKISIPVDAYVVHPNWNSNNLHNDIALLRLASTVSFNDKIKALALPSANDNISDGTSLTVSGFGATSDNSGISNNLNYVQVHSISEAACRNVYGSVIWEGQICTQGSPNEATCGGDSGGPLVKGSGDNRVSAGIVSFGSSLSCTHGYPNGFTKTAYYRDWIKEVSGV